MFVSYYRRKGFSLASHKALDCSEDLRSPLIILAFAFKSCHAMCKTLTSGVKLPLVSAVTPREICVATLSHRP